MMYGNEGGAVDEPVSSSAGDACGIGKWGGNWIGDRCKDGERAHRLFECG